MPVPAGAQNALDTLVEYLDVVPEHDLPVDRLVLTQAGDPQRIRALAEYAEQTGHRLVLNYRNPHGRATEDRKIVVKGVRTGKATNRAYIDALTWPHQSPRTFTLDRVISVRLDGTPA